MADTAFGGFALATTCADTDTLLGETAAGGGVNYRGTAFVRTNATRGVDQKSNYSTYYQFHGTVDSNNGVITPADFYLGAVISSYGSYFCDSGYYVSAGLFTPTQTAASGVRAFTGSIAFVADTGLTIGVNYTPTIRVTISTTAMAPGADNNFALGSGSKRYSVLYAGTGSINTSDEREKQQIEAIPDDWLDAWADVQWSRFKFNDSVAAKGTTGARWHAGLVAQAAQAAFTAHGIDATEIGLLCHDEWPEVPATAEQLDADGNVIVPADPGSPAGDQYGLRYQECFAVDAAYQRRRMAAIEARLTAIEPRLTALEERLTAIEARLTALENAGAS